VKRSQDALFGVVLFAVALIPRLAVATHFASEPVWDGHFYDFGARRIAAGFGYSDDRDGIWHPWCHYPVGYSAALGLFYRVFGADLRVSACFDSIVGALLAPVTWALARRAIGETRARIAGAIVALHPGLILYASTVMSEPLAALATLTAFWLAVRDTRPKRGLAIGALALGVAALVRPQALLCAPFLALVLPLPPRARRARTMFVAAVAACAIALVPVLPWTIRNCRVMDGCALVSTNAGWNLAIGSFSGATGRFVQLHAWDGCRDVTGQVQQDRCWFSVGVHAIRRDPLRWLALVPAKLGYTFDHESFAVEYLHQARKDDWPEERRTTWRGITSSVHRLLVTLAALGCVSFVRAGRAGMVQGALIAIVLALLYFFGNADAPTFWPLAIFACALPWLPLRGAPRRKPALLLPVALFATTALTHAVFFGEDRYHIVVVPTLAILAAAILRRPAHSGTITA